MKEKERKKIPTPPSTKHSFFLMQKKKTRHQRLIVEIFFFFFLIIFFTLFLLLLLLLLPYLILFYNYNGTVNGVKDLLLFFLIKDLNVCMRLGPLESDHVFENETNVKTIWCLWIYFRRSRSII